MRRVLILALAAVLAVSTAMTGLPQHLIADGTDAGITVSASSTPKLKTINYEKTGNQKKDIIGFAKTQVGYAESGTNNTYFGKWFGLNYNPWCAMFVSWCAAKAGVPKSKLPRLASADRSWAKSQGVYHKSKYRGGNYTPKKGDLIYFSWSGRDWADHIGMVSGTKTVSGTKYVCTIEGNKHDKVVKASYPLNNRFILGYASPKYKTSTEPEKMPTKYTLKYRDGLDITSNDEEDAIIAPVTVKFGKDLTLSETKFTRKGYKYSRWQVYRENSAGSLIYLCRDDKTGTKEKWYLNDSIPSGYTKVTVKPGGVLNIATAVKGTIYTSPVWKKKTYAVVYDANGGTKAPEAQTKTYGDTLTLSKDKPVLTGYKFLGWADTPDAEEAIYKAGDSYKKNKAASLYAVWTPRTSSFTVKVKISTGLEIFSGPDESYDVVETVDKGTELTLNRVDGDWGKIKGTKTWILLQYVKEVN